MPASRGQPRLDPTDTERDAAGRSKPFHIRCSTAQRVSYAEAAAAADSSVSEWARDRLDEAAAGRDAAIAELRGRVAELEAELVEERAGKRKLAGELRTARAAIERLLEELEGRGR